MAQFDAGSENTGYKLYTGLTDVQVVAVNPTMEEAEKLGINLKSEPLYVTKDNTTGNDKVRIDIYVRSKDSNRIDKMAFFMENTPRVSQKGSTQYINDFGVSCYAENLETALATYQWFKPQGARSSFSGEPELIDFIKSLLNIGRDSVAKLDNFKALFTGNVSELREVFNKFQDRKVQVLYYVRENDGNWYQGIYTRYFSRAGNTTTKYWDKNLENSTSKPNYQNSYKFQEFNPLEINSDENTPEVSDAPKSIWGN